jgi:beta-glucanase (GH16 family)
VIGTQKGKNIQIQGVENDFHNYILEWTDSKIEIFVDDKKYFEFAKEEGWEKWPFFKEFHLILNIAVGGNWGGKYGIDEKVYPQRMEIDYVRVYQNN